VRQLFISSAAELVEEFHVDGLRVDLTQAMHRDNSLNANGWSIRNANLFGQKCLREWSRTLRMIRPTVMLIAEDHTGWDAVTKVPTVGGLGFDATWLADLYHHLIGDADAAGGAARLIRDAGKRRAAGHGGLLGTPLAEPVQHRRVPRVARRGGQRPRQPADGEGGRQRCAADRDDP
jgi:hypothetical protein